MKYSEAMFNVDFSECHTLAFDSFDYAYFVALQDIPKWDGKWNTEESFLVKNLKTGQSDWVNHCNVQNSIANGEVFIGGVYRCNFRHSISICRGTGVSFLPKPKKYKRDTLVKQEINRRAFRRERPIWDWYDKEVGLINQQIREEYRKMNDSFCELDLDRIKKKTKNKFKFFATTKSIKTKHGLEVNAYMEDFVIEADPFGGKIIKDYNEAKKCALNYKEFKNAKFPLYEIHHNDVYYFFQKNDFELVENVTEKIELEYINQWELAVIALERKKRNCRKWLDRCLAGIRRDVEQKLGVAA